MPEIKLQHVVSVSSEDKNYPAENLLKCEGFKKWKSKNVGEKQVTATFQLEKASKINQIDIGNEGTAFVEILVGKASAKDGDFQVILVASSFMSPSEGRNNQNTTRVRMFGSDQLSKAVLEDNWDLVKVVCTQPFNKSIQYGLSFIKFHSGGGSTTSTSPQKQSSFGAFKVKTDASDDIKPGGLFARRLSKETTSPAPPLTGAAAARAASRLADETKPSETSASASVPAPKRKHSDGGQVKPSPAPEASPKTPLRKQSTSISSTSSGSHSSQKKAADARPPLKKMKTEPPKPSKEKEFSRLMEKVTFVLSGFQNPERAKLRDRATEMGATYKGDWGKGCTHLICAFENTPKYNQVKGKGRIVKKDFVRDCYKQRKLLPWRDYRLGKARSPPPSSDEDSDSGDDRHTSKKAPAKDTPKKTPSKLSKAAESDSGDYGASTDEGDTDDEIKRATAPVTKKKSPTKKPAAADDDVYSGSTDEEENGVSSTAVGPDGLPVLPDFFTGKRFFLYGKYPALQQRTLNRFIVAYNGCIEEYMGDNVHYVITDSDWDKHFDRALTESPQLVFVKSDWIHACDEKQKLVPHQKYNIVPQ